MADVMRDVLLVGRAEPDCLEGGTHEETLRPQVNPKLRCQGVVEKQRSQADCSRIQEYARLRRTRISTIVHAAAFLY